MLPCRTGRPLLGVPRTLYNLSNLAPAVIHPMLSAFIFVKAFVPFSRYFQAGGSPENVIQLLSENYTAVAQTVNLLAEWLIQTGALWGPYPGCSSSSPAFQRPLVTVMLINWKAALSSWLLRHK